MLFTVLDEDDKNWGLGSRNVGLYQVCLALSLSLIAFGLSDEDSLLSFLCHILKDQTKDMTFGD